MAMKNVILDRAFGNNLSGQPAIDVIFVYTVANYLDNDSVPRGTFSGPTHFLNLQERTPYVKDAAGSVFKDTSKRAIDDAAKWNYRNSHVITPGDIYASNMLANC